jgi:hypothetical protein
VGIQSGEWRARGGALPEWRAQWRAHTGLQRHRLVPRPTSIARAVTLAVRARSARKTIVMLIFCVRRSPGDSAAATGWSGERRPMVPLAVSLPRQYRIVSVCRVSHAKHAWIADSVHQTDSAADRSFGHADRAALNLVHRQGSCGRGHVPTPGPLSRAVTHVSAAARTAAARLGQSSQSVRHTHQGEVRACRGSLREPGEKFWDCMIGDEVLPRSIGSAEHLVRLVRRQLLHRRLVPQVAG